MDGYVSGPMTKLYLARHGETDWNLEHRWQGHADPPLNETGRAQARMLGGLIAGFGIESVWSSDLVRARETAEIVARGLGLVVRPDPRLREVDVGEWSGLTMAEVEARFPAGAERRRAGGLGWERGETYESLASRSEEALLEVDALSAHRPVLVVTHGGVMRTARRLADCSLADWLRIGNCELDVIEVREGRMRWLDSTRGGLHQQVQG